MKLEIKKSDVPTFVEHLKLFNELAEEINVSSTEKGLHIKVADQSVILAVETIFHRDFFRNYYCPQSEEFGINLPDLLDIMKKVRKDDVTITMETTKRALSVGNGELREISVMFNGRQTRIFKEALLKIPPMEIVNIEKLETEMSDKYSIFTIETKTVEEAIKDMGKKYNNMVIYADPDKKIVVFFSEFAMRTYKNIVPVEKIRGTANKSKYDIHYVENVIKHANKISPTVKMIVKDDFPLIGYFKSFGVETRFAIAPKIGED